MDSFDISASALSAQRLRMDVISGNLANINTTRKEDGSLGAYKRKNVVFAPILDQAQQQSVFSHGGQLAGSLPMKPSPSGLSMGPDGRPMLTARITQGQQFGSGVQVMSIQEDNKTPLKKVFDPSHPDADDKGYVEMPNINVVTEMVDLISASRAYEANISAFQSSKSMNRAALDM